MLGWGLRRVMKVIKVAREMEEGAEQEKGFQVLLRAILRSKITDL